MALLWLPIASTYAQPKLYRWVDDEGQVHYGDRIPPEHAGTSRDILNERGITVGFEAGELTDEERAEVARLQAIEDAEQAARDDATRRDRMLLDTYLSVADIEDLRDRRLGLLGSQIQVTELYLNNLRNRLLELEAEASDFRPYNESENAADVPENLALEISQTGASITTYEQTLTDVRSEEQNLKITFERDIVRFRQLTGS